MYQYDSHDQQIVNERVNQFKDQTERFLAGDLTEEEFLPLRLQNGLYIQRFAPMFRIAVPYGLLSSKQVRKLAHITRTYDKGYAHVSTRQNIQLNWPELENVPDILAELAEVQMHAIQTSGNCIRNTTTDQFAGAAADEQIDPRPYCELIRQWSTFHPEFAFLPRKFKIAVNGAKQDRAAIEVHDIGLELVKDSSGNDGFKVLVGGGLGRTPIVSSEINSFLPRKHILTYLDAILRVYNRYGRRDNKYKARIKILVKALTPEVFADKVNTEWLKLKDNDSTVPDTEFERLKSYFIDPQFEKLTDDAPEFIEAKANSKGFANWVSKNTNPHKKTGYASVTLTLKKLGVAPGDISDKQLDAVADLADKYSFSEIRNSHNQNMILAHVKETDLFNLWQDAKALGFATPNLGYLTDLICCPGGDFCALANAKSLPVAEEIQARFDNLDYLYDLGKLDLNISGCMNACGHHHVGNIGILGVDKKGSEFYQISLGGYASNGATIGKILGPSFARDKVVPALEKIIDTFVEQRQEGELFIDTYRRVGIDTFKERVYAKAN